MFFWCYRKLWTTARNRSALPCTNAWRHGPPMCVFQQVCFLFIICYTKMGNSLTNLRIFPTKTQIILTYTSCCHVFLSFIRTLLLPSTWKFKTILSIFFSKSPKTACKPGTYGIDGQCVPCPIGQFNSGGQWCLLCPQGTYQDETGWGQCKQCPQGTFQPHHAQTSAGEIPNNFICAR